MNNSSTYSTPMICDQNTNLHPFFESCLAKAKNQNATLYSSITFETNYSDPLAILEQIHEPNQSVCYFEKQSEEFSIACGDPIVDAKFNGSDRFKHAKGWSQKLLSNTLVAGDHKVEGSGPTLFLNATFEKTSNDSKHPALQVFLPHWQVIRKGGTHFIIINSVITPFTNAHELNTNIRETLEKFNSLHDHRPRYKNPERIQLGKPVEENIYERAVAKALRLISQGKISKIVLARKLVYQTQDQLPYFSIAHSLRNKFPDCYTFCMSTPDKGMFIGATPEILTRISGNSLETEAVAGTAARGPSAGKDAHLGKTLLGRNKEVREHRLVIDSILRRLKSCGISECKEGRSRLLRLANLQHVRTPLQATLADGVHPFDAISALHPTPAMGGSPREEALPLVHELEGFSRGWYSGIAGWFDSRGRGEFMVPIRCGKIMPNSLTLFAGAGIVEGSTPANEKAETDLKLEAMLEVITGKSSLLNE